ncbi:hypothetical protein ACFYVL_19885 [Streptomyces sp. NPDC004111]|uniref:hypothetical protein n=1 Tax=Streptomyces sp. NPDC004111 TaxID=3364690 RepID=UPI0036B9A903
MVTSGRSAWGGRLLLFAALLFGIVTMHTLGHPAEEHGGGHGAMDTGTVASSTATTGHTGTTVSTQHTGATDHAARTGSHERPHEPRPAAHAMPGPASGATGPAATAATLAAPVTALTAAVATVTAATSPAGSPHGMDPMSVCLAVLGAWGVALLGAWLVVRRAAATDLVRVVRGALLRALWPQPPPPRTVLARLSVLRI